MIFFSLFLSIFIILCVILLHLILIHIYEDFKCGGEGGKLYRNKLKKISLAFQIEKRSKKKKTTSIKIKEEAKLKYLIC